MSGDRYVAATGYMFIAVFLTTYVILRFLKPLYLISILGGFSTILEKTCIIMSIIGLLLISSGWLSIGRRLKISEACICGETGLITFSALFLFYTTLTLSHSKNTLDMILKKLGKDILSEILLFMIMIVMIFVLTHVISHFTVSRLVKCTTLRIAGYLHILLISCTSAYLASLSIGVIDPSCVMCKIVTIAILVLLPLSCTCSSIGVYNIRDVS
ncbi:MAG: hypothetical protein GXO26_08885 [Crenarchaeota archaeon]|nr:hypothetical protein [Thermoproteota archaeon]